MKEMLIFCPGCGLPLEFNIDQDVLKGTKLVQAGLCTTCLTELTLNRTVSNYDEYTLLAHMRAEVPEEVMDQIRAKRREFDCSITQTQELKARVKELENQIEHIKQHGQGERFVEKGSAYVWDD